MITFSHCISEGILESGDAISHYQLSRYSWKYPLHLLDHWGKPLFTLLSSPFAQLGFNGYLAFGLFCSLVTGWYVMRIAKCYGVDKYWMAGLFLFCAPVYAKVVLGGMTEVLFGLVLVISLWELLKHRYVRAAILLSFMPFIRPEAYIILPLYGMYIATKDWKALPYLIVGNLLYGIVGFLVLDDFFWIFNEDPYLHKEPGTYGFGKPFHFIDGSKNIFGIPITIVMVISLIMGLGARLRGRRAAQKDLSAFLLLLVGPILGVFVVHSVLWWKGLNGSLGLFRVIATVGPLVAVVSAEGVDRVLEKLKKPKWRAVLSAVIALVLIITLIDRIPLKVDFKEKELMAIEAADWVKENAGEVKLFYQDPLLIFRMDIDPFDQDRSAKVWGMNKQHPSKNMKSGEIIIWDGHYCPVEAGMPKETNLNDPELELLKEFRSEPPLIIFGDREYELLVLRKR